MAARRIAGSRVGGGGEREERVARVPKAVFSRRWVRARAEAISFSECVSFDDERKSAVRGENHRPRWSRTRGTCPVEWLELSILRSR